MLVCMLLLLCSCESARFYGQAVSGHLDLMRRRQPIDRILEDESAPRDLRDQLQRVTGILSYAEGQLELPVEKSYEAFVRLDRAYVSWNVAVAPEFDLNAKSWWYPIVGRLEQRAYFRESAARRFASRMRQRGYDVAVGGVLAYSTLGWFRDPVLSSMLKLNDTDLAELLFHELAHQRVFAQGDTDFNEAFAVFVAEHGVLMWLGEQQRSDEQEVYRRYVAGRDLFAAETSTLRRTLEAAYPTEAERRGEDGADKVAVWREQKESIIAEFRQEFRNRVIREPLLEPFVPWVEGPINNATLTVLENYYHLVPGFRRLRMGATSMEAFYQSVEDLANAPKTERYRRLLQSEPADAANPVVASR